MLRFAQQLTFNLRKAKVIRLKTCGFLPFLFCFLFYLPSLVCRMYIRRRCRDERFFLKTICAGCICQSRIALPWQRGVCGCRTFFFFSNLSNNGKMSHLARDKCCASTPLFSVCTPKARKLSLSSRHPYLPIFYHKSAQK